MVRVRVHATTLVHRRAESGYVVPAGAAPSRRPVSGSDAMKTLRELVTGSDVPPSVRLRASLAILQAADALTVEEIGPTTAESVRAKIEHDAFIESLGG
jgi:hypothetical protein